ncbi:MAG: flagellar basal body P-ring formation chaperone FlgA [Xanthobacteraceae bacterium]|jgi:flagella basal body P-ring formation protein FlgA
MTRPLLTLVALLVLSGAAAAQTPTAAPALKAHVTVTSDLVRIGDIVENAGPVADVPIFRAPDLGTTGAVATDRIVDAIRPHQLIGIDTRGLAEVIVTRASRAISVPEITASIAKALAGQYGFGDAHNVLINFDRDVRTLQVEQSVTGDLQVMALSYDPHTTRFDVTFGLPSSVELRRQSARYSGTAIETIDAVGVDHPIEHGQVLKASDLTVLRRPKSDTGALTERSAVVGLAARHPLRPGQPLSGADLMKPEIVQHNDSVTIVFQAPGVTLTLRGQAQEAGALGDTIGVLNLDSKRVVQALISGPDRVTVGPVVTRIVGNAAFSAD